MVERKYQPENQEMLSRRQGDHARQYFSTSEEAAIRAPRVVIPMLQPQNGIGLPIRDSIFECTGDRFDGLTG
jgi:hypothetical protein